MKKRAVRKEFIMEMKKSMNRFLSILFIVALGVAFFSGIRASEPDMRLSLDEYFDESHLMDVQVIGTLGMAENDLDEIQKLDCVETAEAGYSADVLCDLEDSQNVIHVMSVYDTLNQSELLEGEMPEAVNECVVDDAFAQKYGLEIGDTLSFYLEDGEELEDTLKAQTFTITGMVSCPMYISWNRGSSQIGNGEINGYILVSKDSFALDCYTQIAITAAGAANAVSYTEEYTELVEQLKTVLEEELEEQQCETRYTEIKSEAEEELADAEKEVADAEDELADGRIELTDAQSEVDEGWQELKEQEQQLKDSKAQLEDSRAQLSQGEAELQQKQQEYEENKTKTENELATACEELTATEAQLDETEASLAQMKQLIDAGQTQLQPQYEAAMLQLSQGRETLEQAWSQYNEKKAAAEAALAAAETQLAAAQAELEDGKQQLLDGEAQLADGETKLAEAKQELTDAQNEIDQGWQELLDGEEELSDAKQKVLDGQEELEELELPRWYIQDRTDLPQYTEGGDNAERIKAIGHVFPVIFFLVAALISLTTMTRMVEEERTQIGIFSALGYGKQTIAGKYLLYAGLATIMGSVLGVLIGEKIIPYVIVTAYQIMYPYIPNVVIPYQLSYGVYATAAALASTMIATLAACYAELTAKPAALMRPVPPKNGKRILLERIGFIWKRLSFSQKSTFRNIFRYKKRFFMTILGIGGCMGLMLVGFGIKDSVFEITDIQYRELHTYEAMISYDADDETVQSRLEEYMSKQEAVSSYEMLSLESATAKKGSKKLDAYLFVPQVPEAITDFVTFRTRIGHEPLELKSGGVIISEKLSSYLNLDVGDYICVEIDNQEYELKISGITEHYLHHYVYITPEYYEEIFGQQPTMNTCIYASESGQEKDYKEIGEAALLLDGVVRVTYVDSLQKQMDDMLESLNIVIAVLIISAGMLAFVVLYNLNNININERRRELASFKVLGFYDKEVAQYVYRENIWLTGVGVLLGCLFGKILHRFIIVTVEIESCMFGRTIALKSYLYSALFTVLFALVVNGVMYFKLKKIDMIESLKNVE